MTTDHRTDVTELVADLLELSPTDRGSNWAKASPPGRYAATVLHLLPSLHHRYQQQASTAGIAEIGVKVFKTTRDARQNEGEPYAGQSRMARMATS
jgi:hypothetical protein